MAPVQSRFTTVIQHPMISHKPAISTRTETVPVRHRGLEYRWHPEAFLNRAQATYALKQLGRLCQSETERRAADQRIVIPAATAEDVGRLFDTPVNDLAWLPLERLARPGSNLVLDTDRLPAAVALSTDHRSTYVEGRVDGRDPFPVDLVAFTYLMLTRWEEAVRPLDRDVHGRVLRRAMLSSRQGFHQRPVIDEWALVLRTWLRRDEPDPHAEAHRRARVLMTHDVDHPYRFASPLRVAQYAAAELIRHSHSAYRACREFHRGWRSWWTGSGDPYQQAIEWLMDLDEWLGVRGHFFFMTADSGRFDAGYDLRRPRLRQMLAAIENRNHNIGWHPGYRTAADPTVFARELTRFRTATGQNPAAGRQHYLNWDAQASWERWSDSGAGFDCSLGFSDCCGFRCGTAHPYPAYSRQQDCELPLWEHPLQIMDCGLHRECDDQRSAEQKMMEILQRVRQVGGEAVTLIHNSFVHSQTVEAMLGPLKWLQESSCGPSAAAPVGADPGPWPAVRRCA